MAASNKSEKASTVVTSSSVSSVARARAKAEAAKVRASYASKEAQLKVEKTKIDVELEVLMLHREADIAVAEAAVLEEEAECESRKSVSDGVKRERTQEYVRSQIKRSEPQGPPPVPPANDNNGHSGETLVTWDGSQGSDPKPQPKSSKPKPDDNHAPLLTQRASETPKVEQTKFSVHSPTHSRLTTIHRQACYIQLSHLHNTWHAETSSLRVSTSMMTGQRISGHGSLHSMVQQQRSLSHQLKNSTS